MTKLLYLEDSYLRKTVAKITGITIHGTQAQVTLSETILYPQGGGQPSDHGTITTKSGSLQVTHSRIDHGQVVHQGNITGTIQLHEKAQVILDWERRFAHMRLHSGGHIVHEAVCSIIPQLQPIKADHSENGFIQYQGEINPTLLPRIEREANLIVARSLSISSRLVTADELKKYAHGPSPKISAHKPLRVVTIAGYDPVPDGGTQVSSTEEVGRIRITSIHQAGPLVQVGYTVEELDSKQTDEESSDTQESAENLTLERFRSELLALQQEIYEKDLTHLPPQEALEFKLLYIGSSGKVTKHIKKLRLLAPQDRKDAGILVNECKLALESHFKDISVDDAPETWFDVTLPAIFPPLGNLHIVTTAIAEITHIFERLGFSRKRHPEVDWDYYAFESLNMPTAHPARDEWETFNIKSNRKNKPTNPTKFQNIVLTPHTSNGQVREMEKGQLPIRMINISKCYRRQSDVSHVPMFHQFEGLYVDKNVSIGHLKGVLEYFVKQFFGSARQSRIRPYHFQFTEPSFEIDISCGICLGKGCKLCKDGWLELGGAGMVHPVVLKNGGVDTQKYNGFAFGWGIERTYMMKAGTKLDDIRLLYTNDIRFLEQF